MNGAEEYITSLYQGGEYVLMHPSLHAEDSAWKVTKLLPLVDRFILHFDSTEIKLLDVGGGAGMILSAISDYLRESHRIRVEKHALDLSPAMIEMQRRSNPDLIRALNEDIRKTSFSDKEIDLALMIDVLEHVPNPLEALMELRRISKFAIFKVALEDTLLSRVWNFVSGGKHRQRAIEVRGHINVYCFSKLRQQVERYTGDILAHSFTNVSEYYNNAEHHKPSIGPTRKLQQYVASTVFKASPKLCTYIFDDYVVMLVRNH